jgi:hypothetical protein
MKTLQPFRFLCVSVLLLVLAGCSKPYSKKAVTSPDNSRLYWCIELIESGKIRRGMDTASLKEIFGEWIEFSNENEAISFLSPQRADSQTIVQLPAPWYIKFSISQDGVVTNYFLCKSSGK